MKNISLVIAFLFISFIGTSQPNFDDREYHTKTGLIIYEESFGYNMVTIGFIAEPVGLGLFENKLFNEQSLVIIINDNENNSSFSIYDMSRVIGGNRRIIYIGFNKKNVSADIFYDNGEMAKFTANLIYINKKTCKHFETLNIVDNFCPYCGESISNGGIKLEWTFEDSKNGGYYRELYIKLKEN